jgi:hypothetical protein
VLETNCPIIFVLVDIGLNFNGVFSNEIFSFILGLVHVEGELNASTLREGGDKEVDGTFGHNHHILAIDLFEVGLDGKASLVELLLA